MNKQYHIDTVDTLVSGIERACVTSAKAVDILYTEGLDFETAELLVDLAYRHPGKTITLQIGFNDEYQITLK